MPIMSAALIEELYMRVQAAQQDDTVDVGELLWDDFPSLLGNMGTGAAAASAAASASSPSSVSAVNDKAREMVGIAEQVLSSKEILLLCLSMRPTLSHFGEYAKNTLLRLLTNAVTKVSKLKSTVLNDTALMAWDIVGVDMISTSAPPPATATSEASMHAQQQIEREKTRKCQTMCIFIVKLLDNLATRMEIICSSTDSKDKETKKEELDMCIEVAVIQACALLGHVLSIGMDPAFVAIGSQVLKKIVVVHPNVLTLLCTVDDFSEKNVDDGDNGTESLNAKNVNAYDVIVHDANNSDTLITVDDLWDSEAEEEELAQTDIDVAFLASTQDIDRRMGDRTSGIIDELSSRGQACITALICAYGECAECIPVVISLSYKLRCFAPHILTLLSDPDPMVARRGLLVTRRLCGSLHPMEGGGVVPDNAWKQYVSLISSVCSFMATCPDSRLRSSAHGCVMDVLTCVTSQQRMLVLKTLSVSHSLSSPAKGLLLDAIKKDIAGAFHATLDRKQAILALQEHVSFAVERMDACDTANVVHDVDVHCAAMAIIELALLLTKEPSSISTDVDGLVSKLRRLMDACDSEIRIKDALTTQIEAEHLFPEETARTLVTLRAPNPQPLNTNSSHNNSQTHSHEHGHSHGVGQSCSRGGSSSHVSNDQVYDGGPLPAEGQDDASKQRARAMQASYRAQLARNNAERVMLLLRPTIGK